jgi:TolA-binding protein
VRLAKKIQQTAMIESQLSAAQQRLATLEGEMTELCAQLQEAVAHAEREAKATTASSKSARQVAEVAHEASTDREALLAENGALQFGLIFVRRVH